MEVLMDEVVEFPVISQDLVGYPNQFTYLSVFYDKDHSTQLANNNAFLKGFLKYDLSGHNIIARVV